LRRGVSFASLALGMALSVGLGTGCGGYNGSSSTTTSTSTTPTSGLTERVFVANQNPNVGQSAIDIVDASRDQTTGFFATILGTLPQLMVPGAKSTTLVFDQGTNGITILDNIKESPTLGNEIQLPGPTESMAESSDAKFVYATVRATSQVVFTDITGSSLSPVGLTVPEARRLVLSPNNNTLLVFSDDLNTLTVIDTTKMTNAGYTPTVVAGFDRPTWAVFSSDSSKAYVLNCGPECGGKQASVTVFDIASLTPGQTVNVDAATMAVSDTTNLYVAGTSASGGKLDVVTLSGLASSKSIAIGDGFHNVMTLWQGKVLIGARTCTTGCLSIADAAAGTAIIDTAKGDVTAIAPILPRKVFYVTEGGVVRIYDPATGTEQSGDASAGITGKATSVLYVGPKTS
jgi:hypothetical protein